MFIRWLALMATLNAIVGGVGVFLGFYHSEFFIFPPVNFLSAYVAVHYLEKYGG